MSSSFRRNRFATVTISDLARDNPEIARLFPDSAPQVFAPSIPFDPLSLTTLQQAALMHMHESAVSRAVMHALQEDCETSFGMSEFVDLRELGLCERKFGFKYHTLTGEGRSAAKELEHKLCVSLGIHELLYGSDMGATQIVRCSCGGWSSQLPRGHSTGSWANRYHARHVDSVQGVAALEAALKPPGMVGT